MEHVFSRLTSPLPNTHRVLAQGPFLGGESPIWQPSRDRTRYSRPPIGANNEPPDEGSLEEWLTNTVRTIFSQVIFYRLRPFAWFGWYPTIWIPQRLTQSPPPDYLFVMLGRRFRHIDHTIGLSPELLRQIMFPREPQYGGQFPHATRYIPTPYVSSLSFPLMENKIWYFWFC